MIKDENIFLLFRFLKPFIGIGFTVNTLVTCITRNLNFSRINRIKIDSSFNVCALHGCINDHLKQHQQTINFVMKYTSILKLFL